MKSVSKQEPLTSTTAILYAYEEMSCRFEKTVLCPQNRFTIFFFFFYTKIHEKHKTRRDVLKKQVYLIEVVYRMSTQGKMFWSVDLCWIWGNGFYTRFARQQPWFNFTLAQNRKFQTPNSIKCCGWYRGTTTSCRLIFFPFTTSLVTFGAYARKVAKAGWQEIFNLFYIKLCISVFWLHWSMSLAFVSMSKLLLLILN